MGRLRMEVVMFLKISKLCEILSFKLKQKSLYFELKHYISNNESYFRHIHYWERCMGKTYSLIKLAKKFKCPIAVPTQSNVNYIKRLARDLKIKDLTVIPCNQSILGKRYNLILCEEGIDENFIYEVLKPMSQCLIGYKNVDMYNREKCKQEYECNFIKTYNFN
jgi:thiaminase